MLEVVPRTPEKGETARAITLGRILSKLGRMPETSYTKTTIQATKVSLVERMCTHVSTNKSIKIKAFVKGTFNRNCMYENNEATVLINVCRKAVFCTYVHPCRVTQT